MFGWSSRAAARASRKNRWRASRRRVRLEHLQGDVAIEARVVRPEDLPVTPLAERLADLEPVNPPRHRQGRRVNPGRGRIGVDGRGRRDEGVGGQPVRIEPGEADPGAAIVAGGRPLVVVTARDLQALEAGAAHGSNRRTHHFRSLAGTRRAQPGLPGFTLGQGSAMSRKCVHAWAACPGLRTPGRGPYPSSRRVMGDGRWARDCREVPRRRSRLVVSRDHCTRPVGRPIPLTPALSRGEREAEFPLPPGEGGRRPGEGPLRLRNCLAMIPGHHPRFGLNDSTSPFAHQSFPIPEVRSRPEASEPLEPARVRAAGV